MTLQLDARGAILERLPSVRIPPMRAVMGTVPSHPHAFAFEVRWEGCRTLLRWDGRRLRLRGRANRDLLPTFPELAELSATLSSPVLLDGAIVALDETGITNAKALMARTNPRHAITAWDPGRWSIVYIIFDLLHYAGQGLLACSWQERRGLLEQLSLHGTYWATPPVYADHQPLMATARARGEHGILAKHRDSPYLPGITSQDWIDIGLESCECLVIGGYQCDLGNATIRALILGYFATDAEAERGYLRYAGRVATESDQASLAELRPHLAACEAIRSPFTIAIDQREVVWCRPCLVVEVSDITWNGGGLLGQARYARLRPDLDPQAIVRSTNVVS